MNPTLYNVIYEYEEGYPGEVVRRNVSHKDIMTVMFYVANERSENAYQKDEKNRIPLDIDKENLKIKFERYGRVSSVFAIDVEKTRERALQRIYSDEVLTGEQLLELREYVRNDDSESSWHSSNC